MRSLLKLVWFICATITILGLVGVFILNSAFLKSGATENPVIHLTVIAFSFIGILYFGVELIKGPKENSRNRTLLEIAIIITIIIISIVVEIKIINASFELLGFLIPLTTVFSSYIGLLTIRINRLIRIKRKTGQEESIM